MRSMLTREEMHALAKKIYAIKKFDEFLQYGIWIRNYWTRSWDDCGTSYSSWDGELMLHDGVTILEIKYMAYNAVVISVNPLKYDFDVHVQGMRQIACDVIR